MNHIDLFSGIGGFSLAAQRVWGNEHNIVAFVEQDRFCQKVLNKHWPLVPIFSDIHDYKPEQSKAIDILTAGVPCQPASVAGKRRGKEDDRWLWPEAHRIVRETLPEWIIFENPSGILTLNNGLEFDNLLSELETEGYETQTFIIPACGVDARHRRYRVWIIAHFDSLRCNKSFSKRHTVQRKNETCDETGNCDNEASTNTDTQHGNNGGSKAGKIPQLKEAGIFKGKQWQLEPDVAGVVHGVSTKLDKHRIAALGNAIVPQVVEVIMRGINESSHIKS